jgi:hypothetical protein
MKRKPGKAADTESTALLVRAVGSAMISREFIPGMVFVTAFGSY